MILVPVARTPSGIFAFGGDHLDGGRDQPVAERGDSQLEAITRLQALRQVGHSGEGQAGPNPAACRLRPQGLFLERCRTS